MNGYIHKRLQILLALVVALGGFSLAQGILFPPAETLANQPGPRNPVILFVADGMRQDLMKQLVAEGKMPNYQQLLDSGVDAGKGLIPVVPASSAPNWARVSARGSWLHF